jgi:ribonuclease BN (tRNA processing enzyme)
VELVVLGSSAAWPEAGRAAAGFLLRHEGFAAVLDFGTGTLSNLQRHIPHERLDAVIITHEHLDHCLDLYPLTVARSLHTEPLKPLPLIAPDGVFDRIAALEDEEGVAEMREQLFDVRTIDPGQGFDVGPLHVTTRLLPHMVPNAGLRIEAGGKAVVYTGDTGPSDELVALGRGADLLVAEASWLEPRQDLGPIHLTARQAGEHAARAGTASLLLTHMWPGLDRDRVRSDAAKAFDGNLQVADEGMTVRVGG